ncbi:MAG: hypothetical protein IKQ40_01480 [Lachnospiraceae bacterium]|nr:hypothetical protein [Lachnospiraceae bacterium]
MTRNNISIRLIAATLVLAVAFYLPACSEPAGTVEDTGEVISEKVQDDKPDIAKFTPNAPKDASEPVSKDTAADEGPEEAPGSGYGNSLTDKHVQIRLYDSGKDIFSLWGSGRADYRYGPSMITNDDGSIDAWFAFPGDSRKEYDWLSYKHSDDGGETWGSEKIVLAPTPGSMDHISVCDPDVIYHDGYYYIGYTGTINKEGLCNNVFLARSKNPDGPYEKWDGTGWGGYPIPIIYYNGVDIGWGCGEPSFVIIDNRIFIYSTLDSFSSTGWVRATRVHTADLNDPMWPAKLHLEGICVFREDHTDEEGYTYVDSDSWDVVYLEDSRKFVALTTNRRFTGDSCLLYYESYDGINFSRVSELNTNVCSGCHNCGISGDKNSHIKKGDDVFIGYAYSDEGRDTWGTWATRLAKAKIAYTDTTDRVEDVRENRKQQIIADGSFVSEEPVMLLTDETVYTAYADSSPVRIRYYVMNGYKQKSQISAEDVTIENYDHEMFEISEENELIPLHEGVSNIRLEYNGLRREICVRVLSPDHDEMLIRRFYPVCTRYDIKVSEPIYIKIRPVAEFEDHELSELTGYDCIFYNIRFRSSDVSVCRVLEDGTVIPVSPGFSVIYVEGNDCRYTLEVYVTE